MIHQQTLPARVSARAPTLWRATWASVGCAWGLVTSFSAALTPDHDTGMIYMGLGLLLALVTTLLAGHAAALLSAWFETGIGLLMAIHVAAALTSGVVNGSSPGAVLRYVSLLPAMAVMVVAATRRTPHARDLRLGLTAAGVIFVAYHVAALRPGALFDPTYRLMLFLNANSVGFIAAMTGVSVLTLFRDRPPLARVAGWAIVGSCCLLCLATKSRTALLAGLSGALVVVYQRARESRRVMAVLGGGMLAVGLAVFSTGLGSSAAAAFSDLYMLNDEHRSIESGTFRYGAWSHVVREQWLPNFFLGMGPGRHGPALVSAVGVDGAHNGLLSNLAEVGLVGTAPLLLVLGLALARARRNPDAGWALPLLVTGLVESGAETMLFSMGSSASLLFLLGVAVLASNPARRAPTARAA